MKTLLDKETAERFTEKELKIVIKHIELFKEPIKYELGNYTVTDRLGWWYEHYTNKKDLLWELRWEIKNCKPVEW